MCLFTSVFPDMRRSIREESSHGPGGRVGPGGFERPPPRGSALAPSLYAKPKSLPQHPQLEGYSLCRVCSAASALCPHIEALISAPCLFSPSSSVWFLFLRQFVVSFLPLFVFGRTRLLLLRDREQEGQGSRCGYTRKSPISRCRLS